jgi:tetratricopeptide (TPR) repeat protein
MAAVKSKQHKKPLVRNDIKSNLADTAAKKTALVLPEKYLKWIVFSFAILLYADTLDLKYTLDDSLMITGNTFTQKGVKGIKEIFTNDAFVGFLGKNNLLPGGRYRPLSQVMFAVEKQLFGFNPFVGHLINVLLYALTCMLLYIILRKLFTSYTSNIWFLSLAFVSALLFTAHPLHTEVVANIKGRDEILCLLLSLTCVYLSLLYIEKQRFYLLIMIFVAFFLAILSKENALTFLAAIPLLLYMFTKAKLKDHLLVLLPLIAAILVYFILRMSMIGARISNINTTELLNDPFTGAPLMSKYATIMFTWLKYLLLLVFPHPLTHDYYPKQIPIIGFSDFRAILPVILFGTLLIYSLWKFRSKSIPVFAILFFFITFSIVSNFVFNIGTFMNERFMFTALLSFCVFIGWFITVYLRKKMKNTYRNTAMFILIVLLLGYSVKTISRNRVWMDDVTLFTTDVKVSVNSTKCNTSAGGKLLEKADSIDNPFQKKKYIQQAYGYLNKAVEIYPRNLNAWNLLGNANIKLEDYPSARICFLNCLKINAKQPHALNNLLYLAQVTNKNLKFNEAIIDYKLLLQYKPDIPESYYGLGVAYRGMNKFDSAIISLNKSLHLKPNYVDAMSKLGEIYGQNLNKIDAAEDCFLKAIAINPDDESSLENLGIVYGMKKDFSKSLSYFQRALKIKPEKYELYMNISQTYRIMGDLKSAQDYLNQAQKYKPKL